MAEALKNESGKSGLKIPIHLVQNITGLPSLTLRNWEKCYNLFPAQTTRATFRRSYSIEDRLTTLLFERASSPEVRNITANMQSALARRDLNAYKALFNEPAEAILPENFCEFVAEPILRRIGEFWHEGRRELALAQLAQALDHSQSPVFVGGLSAGLYPKRIQQTHINLLPSTSASIFGRVLGKCIVTTALN